MANPIKGEVSFTAGELGTFVLLYDFNALVDIEAELGVAVTDLAKLFADGATAKMVRTVFRIGLTEHHPEVDDRAAGRIISVITPALAGELIGKAFQAAFPEEKKGGSPRKPAPTAGGTSPAS